MSSSAGGDTVNPINLNIICGQEPKQTFSILPTESILALKERLASQYGIAVEAVRLISMGRILKNEETVQASKLNEGSTVHLVKVGSKPKTEEKQQVSSATLASNVAAPGAAPAAQPSSAFDPARGLASNPALFQQALNMMSQNPQLVRTILASDPRFSSLPPEAQNMLTDPTFMQSMMQMSNNPQMMSSLLARKF